MIKTRAIMMALFVCVFFASAWAQAPVIVKRTITKTDRFDFGAGGSIVITGAQKGSVIVIGSAKNEIEIVAEIELEAGNEADLSKLAEITGFVTDESSIRTSIITVGNHNKFGLKKLPKNFPKNLLTLPFTINYRVTVPRYSDIEIDGGIGDLTVSATEGSMRINFLQSRANIEIVGGSTEVMIGSGSLDVAFGVRGWRGRSANLKVGAGSLKARLPSNMSAEIDAIILKTGTFTNNLPELVPRDRKVPFTDRSIMAKAGVGGAPLKFTVGEGTITLERLKLPL
ncbi:MAG: hypothetical protein ABIV48_08295 [Pyrinomonadaceae bacterium]